MRGYRTKYVEGPQAVYNNQGEYVGTIEFNPDPLCPKHPFLVRGVEGDMLCRSISQSHAKSAAKQIFKNQLQSLRVQD